MIASVFAGAIAAMADRENAASFLTIITSCCPCIFPVVDLLWGTFSRIVGWHCEVGASVLLAAMPGLLQFLLRLVAEKRKLSGVAKLVAVALICICTSYFFRNILRQGIMPGTVRTYISFSDYRGFVDFVPGFTSAARWTTYLVALHILPLLTWSLFVLSFGPKAEAIRQDPQPGR